MACRSPLTRECVAAGANREEHREGPVR